VAYAVPVGSGKDDYVYSTLVQTLVDPELAVHHRAWELVNDLHLAFHALRPQL